MSISVNNNGIYNGTVDLYAHVNNLPSGVSVTDWTWQIEYLDDSQYNTTNAPYSSSGSFNEYSKVDDWYIGTTGLTILVEVELSNSQTLSQYHIVAGTWNINCNLIPNHPHCN